MPTYDYECKDCSNIQEEMHPMTGPVYKIKCSECGSAKMKKNIGATPGYVKGTKTPTKCKLKAKVPRRN